MSWLSDEEQAVVDALKSAAQHPLLPQIQAKVSSIKSELTALEPVLAIIEEFFPQAAPAISVGEALVNRAEVLLNPNG